MTAPPGTVWPCWGGATATVSDSALQACARAGALADGLDAGETPVATALSVVRAAITANAFSIALSNGASLEIEDSAIWGNDVDDVMQDGGLWIDVQDLPELEPPDLAGPAWGA